MILIKIDDKGLFIGYKFVQDRIIYNEISNKIVELFINNKFNKNKTKKNRISKSKIKNNKIKED